MALPNLAAVVADRDRRIAELAREAAHPARVVHTTAQVVPVVALGIEAARVVLVVALGIEAGRVVLVVALGTEAALVADTAAAPGGRAAVPEARRPLLAGEEVVAAKRRSDLRCKASQVVARACRTYPTVPEPPRAVGYLPSGSVGSPANACAMLSHSVASSPSVTSDVLEG